MHPGKISIRKGDKEIQKLARQLEQHQGEIQCLQSLSLYLVHRRSYPFLTTLPYTPGKMKSKKEKKKRKKKNSPQPTSKPHPKLQKAQAGVRRHSLCRRNHALRKPQRRDFIPHPLGYLPQGVEISTKSLNISVIHCTQHSLSKVLENNYQGSKVVFLIMISAALQQT